MSTATAVKLSDKKAKVYEGSKDPKRAAYYEKISQSDMAPLWEVLKDLVAKNPKSIAAPAIWHFDRGQADGRGGRRAAHRRGSRAPRAGAGKPGSARPVAHHRIRFMPACS